MQNIFRFEPPILRRPEGWDVGRSLLWAGSALWLFIYLIIGWMVSRGVFGVNDRVSLWLLGICVGLGVGCGLAWLQIWRRKRRMKDGSRWKALSLEEMFRLSPSEFEEYVAQRIFARRGYTAINTPDVKDGGIDVLVIDRFGNQAVVQCKRYRGTVGEAVIRDLYGTMIHFGAGYGYLFTTGAISSVAYNWVKGKPIELVDGLRLAEMARAEVEDS